MSHWGSKARPLNAGGKALRSHTSLEEGAGLSAWTFSTCLEAAGEVRQLEELFFQWDVFSVTSWEKTCFQWPRNLGRCWGMACLGVNRNGGRSRQPWGSLVSKWLHSNARFLLKGRSQLGRGGKPQLHRFTSINWKEVILIKTHQACWKTMDIQTSACFSLLFRSKILERFHLKMSNRNLYL